MNDVTNKRVADITKQLAEALHYCPTDCVPPRAGVRELESCPQSTQRRKAGWGGAEVRDRIDVGFVETESRTVDGCTVEQPIEGEITAYAWEQPGGTWSGWYDTKEEAYEAAWPGAFIVERTIIQRVHGIKAVHPLA